MTRRYLRLPDGTRWPTAYVRRLLREQRPEPAAQPTLFDLRDDHRPPGERNAAERYAAPSLFSYQGEITK